MAANRTCDASFLNDLHKAWTGAFGLCADASHAIMCTFIASSGTSSAFLVGLESEAKFTLLTLGPRVHL
jgi:hypothetical protein